MTSIGLVLCWRCCWGFHAPAATARMMRFPENLFLYGKKDISTSIPSIQAGESVHSTFFRTERPCLWMQVNSIPAAQSIRWWIRSRTRLHVRIRSMQNT